VQEQYIIITHLFQLLILSDCTVARNEKEKSTRKADAFFWSCWADSNRRMPVPAALHAHN